MTTELRGKEFSSALLDERYEKYTLECGLDVYVFNKKMSAVYALFGVKYGSINNTLQRHDGTVTVVPDGIAHFLEHKLFLCEDGSDAFERFSNYGADANAYTSFNRTAYLFSCTERLDASLGELVDFVTHPYFTADSVQAELGIISEEIKMYDDSPSDRCFYGMLEGMYESHSIRRNICGSVESIKRITPELLYDCYNAFYKPSNMALIVCGDVSAATVIDTVSKRLPSTFCGTPAGHVNENQNEPPTACRPYVERRMQVSKPIFSIGFKDTDIPSEPLLRRRRDAAMAVLDELLFSTSGELYSLLLDEKKISSPSLSYGYTISETFAYNSIAGESDDPRAVLDAIYEYIERVRRQGLDENDFERAKRVTYAEWLRVFDSTEDIANTLLAFACDGAEMLEYTDILADVSIDDVQALFQKSFSPDTATLSVVAPIKQ